MKLDSGRVTSILYIHIWPEMPKDSLEKAMVVRGTLQISLTSVPKLGTRFQSNDHRP